MSSLPYPNWLRPVCSHPFPSPHFVPEEGSHSQCLRASCGKGNTHPAAPLSPCHRWASSLAQAGLCSPGATEMGTRSIAVCVRGRQDHHQCSPGDPVKPLGSSSSCFSEARHATDGPPPDGWCPLPKLILQEHLHRVRQACKESPAFYAQGEVQETL